MNKLKIFLILIIFLIPIELLSQTVGPEYGTLLIIGGHADDKIFIPMFKELAGGDSAEIVIIPTARDDESISKDPEFKKLISRFEKYKFKKISIIHTRNRCVDSRRSAMEIS